MMPISTRTSTIAAIVVVLALIAYPQAMAVE
jgi:hypothetical protein